VQHLVDIGEDSGQKANPLQVGGGACDFPVTGGNTLSYCALSIPLALGDEVVDSTDHLLLLDLELHPRHLVLGCLVSRNLDYRLKDVSLRQRQLRILDQCLGTGDDEAVAATFQVLVAWGQECLDARRTSIAHGLLYQPNKRELGSERVELYMPERAIFKALELDVEEGLVQVDMPVLSIVTKVVGADGVVELREHDRLSVFRVSGVQGCVRRGAVPIPYSHGDERGVPRILCGTEARHVSGIVGVVVGWVGTGRPSDCIDGFLDLSPAGFSTSVGGGGVWVVKDVGWHATLLGGRVQR